MLGRLLFSRPCPKQKLALEFPLEDLRGKGVGITPLQRFREHKII